ncbi:ribonuclease H1-like [Anthonomus grandis grandis]|uniref:ribonuclease H1-like n=1 Tax=Anthonomus grandis grandis TaxID=2921223 RepID=UPI002164F8EB|nr:ribonuclease H1-like [Anthonomus grandis grandis]
MDEESDLNNHQQKRPRDDIPQDSNEYAVAYTDGACENNGRANAKAGIGVWFSNNCPLNISKPVVGRSTNNTAEIQAPVEALKVLFDLGYSKVKIVTDSRFTINCMTKWMPKWKSNNWKLANGGPVKNKEDLIKLDSMCKKFKEIKWEYCEGHKGILGNEAADKLARDGAQRYINS